MSDDDYEEYDRARATADRVIADVIDRMGNRAENSFNDEHNDNVNRMVWDFINNAERLLLYGISYEYEEWEEPEDCEDVRTARRVISHIVDRMGNVAENSFNNEYDDTVNDMVWDFINSADRKLNEWVIRVPKH